MKIHKIQDFINHDSEFFRILKSLPPISTDGPWVAGGSVWKSTLNTPLSKMACDIDFFFKSPQQCESWYRNILTIPYTYRIVSESKTNRYNTTLKYCVKCGDRNKVFTIQLISFKFFSDIQNLLDSFDFTACQFGYDGNALYTGDTSFDDIRNKEIIFQSVSNCGATMKHVKKYTDIGFKIPEPQAKIFNEYILKEKSQPSSPPASLISRFEEILHNNTPSLDALVSQPRLGDYAGDGLQQVAAGDGDYPEPIMGSDSIDLSRITAPPEPSNVHVEPSTFYTTINIPTSLDESIRSGIVDTSERDISALIDDSVRQEIDSEMLNRLMPTTQSNPCGEFAIYGTLDTPPTTIYTRSDGI